MKVAFTIVLILVAQISVADGFVCVNETQDLKVQVYNHVSPQNGTRRGAVVVISNPLAPVGQKTLAVFSDDDGTLVSHGPTYTGKVDVRSVGDEDKVIGDVELFRVDYMMLDIDFVYGKPMVAGQLTTGVLNLIKTNLLNESSTELEYEMSCRRYLKRN